MADLVLTVAGARVPVQLGGVQGPRGEPGGNVAAIGLFDDLPTLTVPIGADRVLTSGKSVAGSGADSYVHDTLATSLALAHPRFCKADAAGRYFRLLPDSAGMVPLSAGRGAGDADETAALLAANTYAAAIGAKGVRFDKASVTLHADRIVEPLWSNGELWRNVSPGSRIDAAGTTINCAPGTFYGIWAGLVAFPIFHSRHTITAALAAGDTVVNLDNVTGLAAGDWVLGRMGDNPADTPEGVSSILTQINSVNVGASTITLKSPVEFAFSSGQLAAAVNNKFFWKVTPITDELDTDIHIVSNGGTTDQQAVVIQGAVSPHIRSLRVEGAETGALIVAYTRGVRVEHFDVRNAVSHSTNRGLAFRASESDVSFGVGTVANCYGIAFAETDTFLHFNDLTYINVDTASRPLFYCATGSRIKIDKLTLKGKGGYYLFDLFDNVGGPVSSLSLRRLEIRGDIPATIGTFGRDIRDELVVAQPGQTREIYDAARTVTRRYTLPLKNDTNRALVIVPPQSILTDLKVYTSTGATAGSIFAAISETNLGTTVADFTSLLNPGHWTEPQQFNSSLNLGAANANLTKRMYAKQLVYGDANNGSGPDLTGQFLIVEVSYIVDSETTVFADSDIDAAMSGKLYGATAYNPPSLAAAAVATTTIAVSGAAVGDRVEVAFDQPLQGISLNAWVSATNTVSVEFVNETAGALDLAAGTLEVWVHVADVS